MNCKPEDLAVIVRRSVGDVTIPIELLGATVRVVEVHETRIGHVWILQRPLRYVAQTAGVALNGVRVIAGQEYVVHVVPDCLLQPIRGSRISKTTHISSPTHSVV